VRGPDLNDLVERLRTMPGVEQTVAFGETVHVTGKDAALVERSLREACGAGGYTIEKIPTSLEDVFIHLMQGATDNFGDDAKVAAK